MQVLKFGGTSVGSPERMQHVAKLIQNGGTKIVVLSAVSGTTNKLVQIAAALEQEQTQAAQNQIQALRKEYDVFVEQLLDDKAFIQRAVQILNTAFNTLSDLVLAPYTQQTEKIILAQGELISTQLFQIYLESIGVLSAHLPALEFMKINANHEPELSHIEDRLQLLLGAYEDVRIFISTDVALSEDFHYSGLHL